MIFAITESKISARNGSAMKTTVTSSGSPYSVTSPVRTSMSLQRR
jgi:hypothetical protein